MHMPSALPPFAATPGCRVRVVGFDFAQKIEHELTLAGASDAMRDGLFVWIDLEVLDASAARPVLESLGVLKEVIEGVHDGDAAMQCSRYGDALHLVLTGCRLEEEQLAFERLDVAVDKSRLVTVHRGTPTFLAGMRREYSADFVRYAQTSSFLIYEFWDHLIQNYIDVQRRLEDQVEALQSRATAQLGDSLFASVSRLGSDLLHFRKILMPARAVLSELATRKSTCVSESSQPYLANMVGTIERVLQDVLVDREILTEAVGLHMSIMAHRTNETVKRLTVVSVIFLPLTFLTGVYGMNIAPPDQPGSSWTWTWTWGFFFGVAAGVTLTLLWLMRRQRLL